MSTPVTKNQLLSMAYSLAGKSIFEIAQMHNENAPKTLLHAKGWIGQLLEKSLGANAKNQSAPDFLELGIELKTLPISTTGQVLESTYICKAPIPFTDKTWETSRVWNKMAQILWIPIEADPQKPLNAQRIGTPILWSADKTVEEKLKQDWYELSELMKLGHYDKLDAHLGVYLQIRPKAPNSKTLIKVLDHDGEMSAIVPKGFYLRTHLTQKIVDAHYALA